MEAPKPSNEFERLIELAELDLDYSNLEENLEDLTELATRIVGTEASEVNLIDSYTQWTVAGGESGMQQKPREQSVCQYTILDEEPLEIKDLREDERFKEQPYVIEDPFLRYYYGVPLKTSNGANIGSLCVLDSDPKDLSPEKKELLEMISKQVVRRLEAIQKIKDLENKIGELNKTNKKVSHDIRNPISGIIGVAEIIEDEVKNEQIDEILELVEMIKKGGHSLLELVEEIMEKEDEKGQLGENKFDCDGFCQKLKELYQPQAKSKGVNLTIKPSKNTDSVFFSKKELLQIVGNLISNAIKFTEEDDIVDVEIKVEETKEAHKKNNLNIKVEDTGIGMPPEKVKEIMQGTATSEGGTGGEKGYGFGLSLVHHLVQKANGQMQVNSEEGKGTIFVVQLPV
ncbi:GAF domain-containing sensor histidine kinase [Aliifodinibius salicampi]|uniref:histidine kinase n=1 Tax=Fodinibius salicampi TaxID=1920655 RepID=A0ABT3Q087_9BACT|nr:GAF domain-containing sensor histidine kinase [Fodinibius salicampi]MCW9713539.1 GAF domain-containing sensor histidine kinase [Fodinibius salicampi]